MFAAAPGAAVIVAGALSGYGQVVFPLLVLMGVWRVAASYVAVREGRGVATVDGKAQQYVAFLQNQGLNIASAELTYVEDVADPAIFRQYRSIPAITDTTSTKTLVEYVKYLETDNPFGYREIYWPITVQLNEEFSN